MCVNSTISSEEHASGNRNIFSARVIFTVKISRSQPIYAKPSYRLEQHLGDFMAKEERIRARNFIGRLVVSEESGRKFGTVGDISFITESGELMNLVVVEPTKHVSEINLQEDSKGRILVPFSSVKSVGDFVIVSEEEIV